MRYKFDLTMPLSAKANSIISFASDRGCTATLIDSDSYGKPLWRYESEEFNEVKNLLQDLKGIPLDDKRALMIIVDTANTA
jgi:hypothetical protein